MAIDEQGSIVLKFSEPAVDSENPWADDLLARKDIATRLTNLVAKQEPPLAISLHGQWGTGKTFMLRRWQKDLENEGFKAIYFNAWEDDFCNDPLLAILGQMSETFKEGKLKTLTEQVIRTATALLKKNALSILENKIGITLETEQEDKNLLEEYADQRASKDNLKDNLTNMAEEVLKETGHPLMFIIDELDRCRPTFAIELLERVKHIFEVPNLVFAFGINRDELCKSLSSIYGNINTDVYLRRFFDFEFNLPEADSQGFTDHLIDKFRLVEVFQSLSEATHIHVPMADYYSHRQVIPKLWSVLGLSLRDIDYGVRLLALMVRNVRLGEFTHPFLLAVLIAVKFQKNEFYRGLIVGNFRTSEFMDYMNDAVQQGLPDSHLTSILDRIEGFLYCADNANHELRDPAEDALAELDHVLNDSSNIEFLVISRRAQNADEGQIHRIQQAVYEGRDRYINGKVFGNLAALIDTYQTGLRR